MSRLVGLLALFVLLALGTRGLDVRDGLSAPCTWTVAGSVGHWGQLHQCRNRYTAEFTVRPVDGAWKIAGPALLDEECL